MNIKTASRITIIALAIHLVLYLAGQILNFIPLDIHTISQSISIIIPNLIYFLTHALIQIALMIFLIKLRFTEDQTMLVQQSGHSAPIFMIIAAAIISLIMYSITLISMTRHSFPLEHIMTFGFSLVMTLLINGLFVLFILYAYQPKIGRPLAGALITAALLMLGYHSHLIIKNIGNFPGNEVHRILYHVASGTNLLAYAIHTLGLCVFFGIYLKTSVLAYLPQQTAGLSEQST